MMSTYEQWQHFLGDIDAWCHELELAHKSADPAKRLCGRMLRDFFNGEPIDKLQFVRVVSALNASLLFKLDWSAVEVVE